MSIRAGFQTFSPTDPAFSVSMELSSYQDSSYPYVRFSQPSRGKDALTEVLREGAQKLLIEAVEAEVEETSGSIPG